MNYTLLFKLFAYILTPLMAPMVKRPPAMRETRVRFLGREGPLEKEMAIHSSTLANYVGHKHQSDKHK